MVFVPDPRAHALDVGPSGLTPQEVFTEVSELTSVLSGMEPDIFLDPLLGDDLPCHRTADPDLFFAERPDDLERAKALCLECPVRTACLAAALERAEPWGVWGGEILDQGVVIARKRPRGRPRKVAA